MNTAPRRALLRAALAAKRVKTDAPELAILHAWPDSWSGLGLVVVGMRRHGYDLTLTHDRNGWRATFLHRSHVLHPWVGQVLHWWPTPWRAVQEAAWRALHTAFARDYSPAPGARSSRSIMASRTRPSIAHLDGFGTSWG